MFRPKKTKIFLRGLAAGSGIPLLVALAAPKQAEASSFTLDSWRFETGVVDVSMSQSDGDIWTTVQNPLVLHQQGLLAPSIARSDVAMSWNAVSGVFSLDTEQLAYRKRSPSWIITITEGTIRITPSIDLLLDVNGLFSYQMPSAEMSSRMSFLIREASNLSNILLGYSEFENAFPGEPASGAFSLAGQVVLPAGHQWRIDYRFRLDAFSGSLGPFATGNGSLDFTLTPANIPEPAALLPLGIMTLILSRRRL